MNTVNVRDGRSPSDAVPRRDRVRAATEAEILLTARELLVGGGMTALTMREVGRHMGMTASALYRYVSGHGDLVDRCAASFFADLTLAIQDAARAAVPIDAVPIDEVPTGEVPINEVPTGEVPIIEVPTDDVTAEVAFEAGLKAAARAFRAWGLAHPAEFALIFGSSEVGVSECPLAKEAGDEFAGVFLELFARGARVQPDATREDVFLALPAPLDLVFARTWVRLLGTVMVEAAGQGEHLPFDLDELFEVELTDCWQLVRSAVRSVRNEG